MPGHDANCSDAGNVTHLVAEPARPVKEKVIDPEKIARDQERARVRSLVADGATRASAAAPASAVTYRTTAAPAGSYTTTGVTANPSYGFRTPSMARPQ